MLKVVENRCTCNDLNVFNDFPDFNDFQRFQRLSTTSQYSAVIPKFIHLTKNGKRPIIYGDGKASRDFTYVSNVVNANLLACKASGAVGEVYNIACNEQITINHLVKKLNDIFGSNVKPIYEDPRPGDVKHSYASIEKAHNNLGYEVKVSFGAGLSKLAL